MTSDFRVKETIIPAFSVNGSTTGVYGTQIINGQIVSIRIQNTASPGSVWFGESGAGVEIWRQNNVTSGTSTIEVYPFIYTVGPTNVTGSPQQSDKPVINGLPFFGASGLTSGTNTSFGPITIRYR